jgi:pimeloyl-ACP methyl ester carboxylesterase/DNA-binding CsgD family transcriptional regulator
MARGPVAGPSAAPDFVPPYTVRKNKGRLNSVRPRNCAGTLYARLSCGKPRHDHCLYMSFSQRIRFCSGSDGVRIAYAVSGRGAPLMKAGNWLTHLELDPTSLFWGHWLKELSASYRLVRYDERCCGLSDWNAEEVSFEAWVRDLETVVDAAGLDRFPLLGVSKGGPLALAYAVRHPERVSRLVLYGAYTRGRDKRAATPQQREEAELMVKLAEIGWDREDPAFRQVFAMQFLPQGTPEQHRSFSEVKRISASPENAARIMRASGQVDVRSLAPDVRCPTLVIHARHDLRAPIEEGRQLAGMIPGARFVLLESRNHILMENEPAWPRFLAELRAFLGEADAEGTPQTREGAFARLSAREQVVVDLIAQGLDNAQIAARLDLSEKTVRNRITGIFAKLEVENRAQVIVRARDAGFGRQHRP